MERRRKNGGLSVPEFGGWNSKNTVPTDYSMVFTQARANRRQRKSDVRHASLGNERELLSAAAAARQQEDSVMVSLLWFNKGIILPA
uniref:RIN4 pathogenic type III effector avirulence factor Avr cleavage site domain-containing protein n=1 Tax=Salix viminalis TaxID=40686 RepID=A0A6N2LVX0_SALVM